MKRKTTYVNTDWAVWPICFGGAAAVVALVTAIYLGAESKVLEYELLALLVFFAPVLLIRALHVGESFAMCSVSEFLLGLLLFCCVFTMTFVFTVIYTSAAGFAIPLTSLASSTAIIIACVSIVGFVLKKFRIEIC